MPEVNNKPKWPKPTAARNQCAVDWCRKQPVANTPYCYEHGQQRWAELRAELEAQQAADFDPDVAAAFDAQNEHAS